MTQAECERRVEAIKVAWSEQEKGLLRSMDFALALNDGSLVAEATKAHAAGIVAYQQRLAKAVEECEGKAGITPEGPPGVSPGGAPGVPWASALGWTAGAFALVVAIHYLGNRK